MAESKDIMNSKKATEAVHMPKPIDPSQTVGNYLILTRSENQIKEFAVFNGTVKILPISALGGAYELK